MTYTTEIDTVGLQVDCSHAHLQREILNNLLDYIRCYLNAYIGSVFYYVGFDERIEYKIYCNNRTVVSFRTGYSNNHYFISIKFAGLKSYDPVADNLSYSYLLVIAAYLNTRQIPWKLTEMDLAIDVMYVPFENLLAICTSHTSRTKYHPLGEVQLYDGQTTWIEKFETDLAKNTAIKRAYLYDKRLKEFVKHGNVLNYYLQRFEIKLQPNYWNKYSLNLYTLANTLDMYHLMYFENVAEKYTLISRYNSYKSVRQREIERMEFERYRLRFDVLGVETFINTLFLVEDHDIFAYRT